jgi:hypothetical protein
MQKLQAKHDDLFEKIVFAQREDKEDIAKSHTCELVVVRGMMSLKKYEYKKLKWKIPILFLQILISARIGRMYRNFIVCY